MIINMIGFWPPEFTDSPPYFILDKTNEYDREGMISYLESGFKIIDWFGYSFCRFNCGTSGMEMGVYDVTDGEWVWPQGLIHYIDKHNIDLPVEFISKVKSENYSMNISDAMMRLLLIEKKNLEKDHAIPSVIKYSSLLWKEWLKQKEQSVSKTECEELKKLITPNVSKPPVLPMF